ncbi:hypothetical protein Tco_0928996, partial [Tanacetum coccineum]
LTAEILGGLTVIAPELPIIDTAELEAPIVDEGGQADPAPVQAPPPAPARTMPQRMARLEEDVHEIRGVLTKHREVIDAMAHDFSRFSTWVTTGLRRMMDRAGVTYVPYAQTHVSYQKRVKQRTGDASTTGHAAARPMIPPILIFCLYLTKPGIADPPPTARHGGDSGWKSHHCYGGRGSGVGGWRDEVEWLERVEKCGEDSLEKFFGGGD